MLTEGTALDLNNNGDPFKRRNDSSDDTSENTVLKKSCIEVRSNSDCFVGLDPKSLLTRAA